MTTILLVDDDDVVRGAIGDWLEDAGFEVVGAEDGARGLEALQANPGIALAVIDLVMPARGPAGAALAEAIRQARPEVPVILMTGYYAAAVRIGEVAEVLFKPLDHARLIGKIRERLSAGGGGRLGSGPPLAN